MPGTASAVTSARTCSIPSTTCPRPPAYRSPPAWSARGRNRQRVEAAALACVQLFVRSSACVEDRNGHLARYHHCLHRLSKRRLKALTVMANYYARRQDGSTAAQRFFGQEPDDLFDWLLDRLGVPAQPRASRLKAVA